MAATRTYVVKVPPSELLARLSSGVDRDGLFSEYVAGNHVHYGTVSNNSFEIKLRTLLHNSFKPVLYGRVDPCPEGSLVRARVGINSFTPIFMIVWLLGTLAFQVLFLLIGLLADSEIRGWVILAPSGMTLFGLLLYRAGNWFSRSEGERLLAYADQLWGPPLPEQPPTRSI